MDTKKIILLGCVCLHSLAIAGSMGSDPGYAGFWAGVGGGYINTTTHGKTNITMVQQTGASSASYEMDNNQDTHFSPIADLGYFYALKNQWYLGAKAVYKYIGSEQYNRTWAGTFNDGTNQTAEFHTKLNQEFFFLLNAGYQFGQWLVYGGLGPSITDVTEVLDGELLPASSTVFRPVNLSATKTIWGGAGQVGFEYMLPNRFMVDISYNFVVSGNVNMPPMYFQSAAAGAYTTFVQRVQVVEQGVNISINKYFML